MNHCRLCNKIIPNTFNGGPALRCSRCRAKQDMQLAEMLGNANLETENEELRNKIFDAENEYTKLNYRLHRMKNRYDLLRQRYAVVLNENTKLNEENARLRKGIERLFGKNHELSKKIEEFIS